MNGQPRTPQTALHKALGAGPSADRLLQQRARLIEWEEQRRRSSLAEWLSPVRWLAQSRRAFALGAALALLGSAVLWAVWGQERAALSAQLGGVALQENAWVTAIENPQLLSFPEGSEVALAAGGRARVAALDKAGLRLTLEEGRVSASITPKTGYRWVIQAGPHTVTVLGTVFDVEWSAASQRLVVAVKRGRVQVESNLDHPLTRVLEAGESLTVVPPSVALTEPVHPADSAHATAEPSGDSRAGEARAENSNSASVALSTGGKSEGSSLTGAANPRRRPAPRPSAAGQPSASRRFGLPTFGDSSSSRNTAAAGPVGVASTTPPAAESAAVSREPATPGVPAPAASWKQLAEGGQFAAAVSAARNVGVTGLISGSSATDLMLLADAARLGKAPELAEQVLLAVRERYPAHPNANVAAFALGRLALEMKHDNNAAVRWFQAYLASSPNGAMAEGARGRLLRAWLDLGNTPKAREAAAQYLKHHPHGQHASVAQSLLGD